MAYSDDVIEIAIDDDHNYIEEVDIGTSVALTSDITTSSAAKKRKLNTPDDVLNMITCAIKDPLHLIEEPIRLPCTCRFICKACMWMSNPNDKTFKCRYCSKRHRKTIISCDTKKSAIIENSKKDNLSVVHELLLSQTENKTKELTEKWRNHKTIVDIKENYFTEELMINTESINIELEKFKDKLLKEFDEKSKIVEKDLKAILTEENSNIQIINDHLNQDINDDTDPFLYIEALGNYNKTLEALEKKVEKKLSELSFEVSTKDPPKSLIGTFRVGSLNFNSKFQNVERMNKVSFIENPNAINGEAVVIDPESNILVLCPQTYLLVKLNFDATKLIECIDLLRLYKNFIAYKCPIINKTTNSEKLKDDVIPLDDNCNNLDDSDSDSESDDNDSLKYFKLLSLCISNDNKIFILYGHRTRGEVHVMHLDKNYKLVNTFEVIEDFRDCRRRKRRYRTKAHTFNANIKCNTNEKNETKLFVTLGGNSIIVCTDIGTCLGKLEISRNDYECYSKIVTAKTFTYILSSQGQRIYSYNTNIDSFSCKPLSSYSSYSSVNSKIDQFKRKTYESDDYRCKSIQTMCGDDLGNCIFIGRAHGDSFMYLFMINYDGQLLNKTKLFNKQVLDIVIDNITSRNYRLVIAVKNTSETDELIWIYEFENLSQKNNDDSTKNDEKKIMNESEASRYQEFINGLD